MKNKLPENIIRVTCHEREIIHPKVIIPRGRPQYVKEFVTHTYYKKCLGFLFRVRKYKRQIN